MTTQELWQSIDSLLEELVAFHHKKMVVCGQRIIPHLTAEDLLQPNDFNELEFHPHFRYEEGILSGVQTVQMALWAMKKQNVNFLDHSISANDEGLLDDCIERQDVSHLIDLKKD